MICVFRLWVKSYPSASLWFPAWTECSCCCFMIVCFSLWSFMTLFLSMVCFCAGVERCESYLLIYQRMSFSAWTLTAYQPTENLCPLSTKVLSFLSFFITGRGPAYFWTSALRLWSIALAQGEEGNWWVCADVCVTCRKAGLSRKWIDCPIFLTHAL